MKLLMVTPMVPHPGAVNAGPLVMYGQLKQLAARHDVLLLTLAGPHPDDWEAVNWLRRSGIPVRAIWRPAPSPFIRRWQSIATFAGPEFEGHGSGKPSRLPHDDANATWTPEPSLVRCWTRRARVASSWLSGHYPMGSLQFWEPEMQQLLDAIVDEEAFDVIQVEDTVMGVYRYPRRALRVLTIHEVRIWCSCAPVMPCLHDASAFARAERHRWLRYQPAIWQCFEGVQVFTPRDATFVREMAPRMSSRVRINPFGIETPVGVEPGNEEADTIVFVGGFCHAPNVEAALWLGGSIMPLIRRYRPGTRLFIVGSHPTKEIPALAGDDITVTGHVPAVERFLARASVVVAPVRSGGGMRLKVLQAMAMGKAVVTTRLGAEGVISRGEAPVMIAEDADGFAKATTALLGAREARQMLGERARRAVRAHHSWPAYIKRLEAMYTELQAGCGKRPESRS